MLLVALAVSTGAVAFQLESVALHPQRREVASGVFIFINYVWLAFIKCVSFAPFGSVRISLETLANAGFSEALAWSHP